MTSNARMPPFFGNSSWPAGLEPRAAVVLRTLHVAHAGLVAVIFEAFHKVSRTVLAPRAL